MHFAILGSTTSWYYRDLVRAAGSSHQLVGVPFADLWGLEPSGEIARSGSVGSGDFDLTKCDGVLVRSMPAGSLEQIVFRMDALGQLAAVGQTVVNPPRALETAVDKYLATLRLRAAGLDVPRTFVCQTPEMARQAFEMLGGRVVIKPLFGAEGRGIALVEDEALLERAAQLLAGQGAVLYLQEFVEHEGADLRLLVIGDRVLGIRRRSATDWRTNLSRGATAEPLEVTGELAALARATAAVGATLAGVDLLPARDGRMLALEVNAVPGWRGLAAALDIDVARLVLDHLAELSRKK